MSIKTLAHACIKTPDLEKTTKFYCGLLGMEKVFNFMRKGEVIGFYMKASANTFIEVFQAANTIPNVSDQCLHHFCLETDDIHGLRSSLLEHGYAPGEVKMGADNSWQFWVNDPNGLAVEFHYYTDRSAQFTGENVEVSW